LELGFLYFLFGAWSLEFGVLFGSWSLDFCIFYLELGAWNLEFGICDFKKIIS
jgi:hypothetical protein